jgi:hypothetical protein
MAEAAIADRGIIGDLQTAALSWVAAVLLRMPKVGFLAPSDPMWTSALDAMGQELVTHSLVYRALIDSAVSLDAALDRG